MGELIRLIKKSKDIDYFNMRNHIILYKNQINDTDNEGNTPLMLLCSNYNTGFPDYKTIITWDISRIITDFPDYKTIKLLIKLGTNINIRNTREETAFTIYMKNSIYCKITDMKVVKLFAKYGILIRCYELNRICDMKNRDNMWNIVKLLIDKVEIIESEYPKRDSHIILEECRYNKKYGEELIQLFINSGVNPNTQHYWSKETPLKILCENIRRYDVENKVRILLNYDIDVNLQDKWGNTALVMACLNNDMFRMRKIVRLILEKRKINLDLKNRFGWTVLMYVCKYMDGVTVKYCMDMNKYCEENLLRCMKLGKHKKLLLSYLEKYYYEKIGYDINKKFDI